MIVMLRFSALRITRCYSGRGSRVFSLGRSQDADKLTKVGALPNDKGAGKKIGGIYLAKLDVDQNWIDTACGPLAEILGSTKIGHVKVGDFNAVKKRLSGLQTGNPFDIVVQEFMHSDEPSVLEKYYHTHFKEKRVRGEWYNLCDKDLEHIKSITRHYSEWGEFHGNVVLLDTIRRQNMTKRAHTRSENKGPPPMRLTFENVKKVLHKYRVKLQQKELGASRWFLDPDEFSLVFEALKMHPQSKEKIGAGVKGIFVQEARVKSITSYCFHVKRSDGSEEDFSYHYCFRKRYRSKTNFTHIVPPHKEE